MVRVVRAPLGSPQPRAAKLLPTNGETVRGDGRGGRMQPEQGNPSSVLDSSMGWAQAACREGWRRYPSARSASARLILADLEPRIVPPAHASADAGEMIGGFDMLVRQLSVGAHLFASLAATPTALADLLTLVARA